MENALSRKIILNSFLTFEPDKKRITGRGNPVIISASASLCLELLIENVGQLVTHQHFYDYVWRRFGTEPASTTLYQNISALRRAIYKAGLQEDIIRTMPRKGFLLSPQTTVEKESLSVSPVSKSAQALSAGGNKIPEHGSSDERMTTVQSEQETDHVKKIFSYSSLAEHRILKAFLGSKKLMAVTILFILVVSLWSFFYIRAGLNYNDSFFIYSTDYKGCTVFNNADGWLRKEEVKKKIDDLKINCSATPYVYLTAFKKADSLSYFNCEHPLDGRVSANCRSHYYVKNLNND